MKSTLYRVGFFVYKGTTMSTDIIEGYEDMKVELTEAPDYTNQPSKIDTSKVNIDYAPILKHYLARSDLFNIQIIGFCGDLSEPSVQEKFYKVMQDLDPEFGPECIGLPLGDEAGKSWNCGQNQIIWVASDLDYEQKIWVLAHELVHAAFNIGESVGFPDPVASQEFHAYVVQWGMSMLYSIVR